MKILVSTSATARQQSNAKVVFGSKAVSILKALEEASKEKTLATPGLDAFLADLKLTGAAFETVSSKAAFTKAVTAAKAFVTAKTFTAKIAALKSLKYSGGAATAAKSPGASKKSAAGPIKTYEELMKVISSNEDKFDSDSNKARAAFASIFGFTPADGTTVGIGTSSDDVGIYYNNESNVVLCLSTDAPNIAYSLGVKREGVYIVYADSYKNKGPFLGNVRPIAGTKKVFTDFNDAKLYFAELSEKINKQVVAAGASFLEDEGIPKLHGDLTFYFYKKDNKVIIVPDDDSMQQSGSVDAIEIPKVALPTQAVFDKIMGQVVNSFMIGAPEYPTLAEFCKRNKFILRRATTDEIRREVSMRNRLGAGEDLVAKQSVPAETLGELYDSLTELTDGDITSDTRLITATFGNNKVSDVQGAADSDGQIGIVLTTPKHEVTIIHRDEAEELFAKVAKLAGLNAKSDYIIYADKSVDGPFYSEKIKIVPGSAVAFGKNDSKTAFAHLKRLCN